MNNTAVLLILPFALSAQITSGVDTLMTGRQSISLSTGTIKTVTVNPVINTYFVPCTTAVECDLLAIDNRLCTCACPYDHVAGVGSPRPFHVLKKSLDSLDLSHPLDLGDTAFFSRVDTVRSILHDRYLPDQAVCCYLPFVEVGAQFMVYVIQTTAKKIALVSIMPHVDSIYSDCMTIGQWFKIQTGVTVAWYVQNDGSLNFDGVTGVLKSSRSFSRSSGMRPDRRDLSYARYDLNGRRMRADPVSRQPVPGVYLLRPAGQSVSLLPLISSGK